MPVRPPEMERTDEVGAAAAAQYFMELYSYVLATGDLQEWDRISAQDCGFCSTVRNDVASVYEAGGRYEIGHMDFGQPVLAGHDEALAVYALQVEFASGAGAEILFDGTRAREVDGEDGYLILDVVSAHGGWLLLSGDARQESVVQT